MKKVLTREELQATEVTEAEVDDTLEHIQAINDGDLAIEIQQRLETEEYNEISHPFFVEGLKLCALAKNMKECPVFDESKAFKISKKKLLSALDTVGVNVPKGLNKEEIAKRLVNFFEKKCDCLTFM